MEHNGIMRTEHVRTCAAGLVPTNATSTKRDERQWHRNERTTTYAENDKNNQEWIETN